MEREAIVLTKGNWSKLKVKCHLILPTLDCRNLMKSFSSYLFVGDSRGQSPMLIILQQLHSFLQTTLQIKQQHGLQCLSCTELFY